MSVMACVSVQRRGGGVVVMVMLATVTLGTLCGFLSIYMVQSARSPRGMVVQPAAGEAVSGAVGDAVCTPHKRILIWTTFWKEQSFAWERIFFRQVSRQCPESRCELVYDHRLLDSAAAVVFHPGDMKPSYSIPATRPPGQPWVFLSLESASTVIGNNVNLARLGGVFNWTMTYRRDSDVVMPYGLVLPRTPPLNSGKDYWAGKSSKLLAAWAVSHCNTESRREWFVKEMVKHMSVDVFGRCGTKKCGKNLSVRTMGTFNQTECTNEIQKYMFYLAFENSICLDYITEKFYQALTLEVVPVVLGGGPYEDIAPPHSYVDALAFPSPKHLAKYLKKLANDRDAYNEFFAWKQHYTVELGHPFSPLVCDLCAKLHDPSSLSPPNVTRSPMEQAGVLGAVRGRDGNGSYPDIHSWFVRGSGCRRWWQSAEDRRKHIHK
ncbi:alpha-(1,3)-fucosyltransferase C-like isoform X2 [Portunus trituberculatus]|uniref:alpha-(1,3)-fucosyltransferase C-like isoform X2 n=1 Tax=Portunus trituberculatus TaxID=210409 RepID=UPI001E1CF59A|nr:alpha-(1,3)-fucosyltransferase C-like isoform X2 [Portunus trituberculatus]